MKAYPVHFEADLGIGTMISPRTNGLPRRRRTTSQCYKPHWRWHFPRRRLLQ